VHFLSPVLDALASVEGQDVPSVGQALALVGQALVLVGQALELVGQAVSLAAAVLFGHSGAASASPALAGLLAKLNRATAATASTSQLVLESLSVIVLASISKGSIQAQADGA